MIRPAVALTVLALALMAGCGDDGPSRSLTERANAACGRDRTVEVIYHPSGFVRRESFETRCVTASGRPYVVVNQ